MKVGFNFSLYFIKHLIERNYIYITFILLVNMMLINYLKCLNLKFEKEMREAENKV